MPGRELGSPADKAQRRTGESNTWAQYLKQTQAWPKHLSGFPHTQIWSYSSLERGAPVHLTSHDTNSSHFIYLFEAQQKSWC
jgi:hypothetical protein